MKTNAINLRPGNVIDHNGKLWVVSKYDIMQPGKGASVIQVEMRDLRSGNKDNVRFRTQETVERVRLEQDNYQYLFGTAEDGYTFMHTETFEQVMVQHDLMGDPVAYLKEGMVVVIETFEGEPLRVQLPDSVTVEVLESEPVVKGQTASSSYKPAIVEGDVKVMVPPHIEAGTRIVVKTEDNTYVERAKD